MAWERNSLARTGTTSATAYALGQIVSISGFCTPAGAAVRTIPPQVVQAYRNQTRLLLSS